MNQEESVRSTLVDLIIILIIIIPSTVVFLEASFLNSLLWLHLDCLCGSWSTTRLSGHMAFCLFLVSSLYLFFCFWLRVLDQADHIPSVSYTHLTLPTIYSV